MRCEGKNVIVNSRIVLETKLDLEQAGNLLEQIEVSVRERGRGLIARVNAMEFFYGLGLEGHKELDTGYRAERESPGKLNFYQNGQIACYIPDMRAVEKAVWNVVRKKYGVTDTVRYLLNYWYFEPYFHMYENTYDGGWGCCKAFFEDRGFPCDAGFSKVADLLSSSGINELFAVSGCSFSYIEEGGDVIGFYTDDRDRVRPITSRKTYEKKCDFKDMYVYLSRINVPSLFKELLIIYGCSSEELIAGMGGREKFVSWLKKQIAGELWEELEKMTLEELAGFVKISSEIWAEAAKEFDAALAFGILQSGEENCSFEVYETVKKRLADKNCLEIAIMAAEKTGGNV